MRSRSHHSVTSPVARHRPTLVGELGELLRERLRPDAPHLRKQLGPRAPHPVRGAHLLVDRQARRGQVGWRASRVVAGSLQSAPAGDS